MFGAASPSGIPIFYGNPFGAYNQSMQLHPSMFIQPQTPQVSSTSIPKCVRCSSKRETLMSRKTGKYSKLCKSCLISTNGIIRHTDLCRRKHCYNPRYKWSINGQPVTLCYEHIFTFKAYRR